MLTIYFWNTRVNATKANLFHTLKRDVWKHSSSLEWISANRISIGGSYGTIEIWQIDDEGETTNSRVIKQFKNEYRHGTVSIGISAILKLCYHFWFSFVGGVDK